LGVGPSAHGRVSFGGGKNETIKISDPFLWKSALEQNKTTYSRVKELSEKEKLTEAVLMGLRLTDGLATEELYRKVSREVVDEIVSEEKLKFLREKKLIVFSESKKIRLTKTGFKKTDAIAEFLLDER
jgi:oxygen-independent coproporphyrinogen-3 oxidase